MVLWIAFISVILSFSDMYSLVVQNFGSICHWYSRKRWSGFMSVFSPIILSYTRIFCPRGFNIYHWFKIAIWIALMTVSPIFSLLDYYVVQNVGSF